MPRRYAGCWVDDLGQQSNGAGGIPRREAARPRQQALLLLAARGPALPEEPRGKGARDSLGLKDAVCRFPTPAAVKGACILARTEVVGRVVAASRPSATPAFRLQSTPGTVLAQSLGLGLPHLAPHVGQVPPGGCRQFGQPSQRRRRRQLGQGHPRPAIRGFDMYSARWSGCSSYRGWRRALNSPRPALSSPTAPVAPRTTACRLCDDMVRKVRGDQRACSSEACMARSRLASTA